MHLLFVCTGNICRSPVGERLTTAWARAGLGSDARLVRVSSAGTGAIDGHEMDAHSAAALRELGGDPTGFTSRSVQPRLAESMDLTLTMTRRQRHKVLKHSPRALRRMFTLPEAYGLLPLADVAQLPRLPVEQRATELATLLNEARPLRTATDDDDIADPIGQSARVHQAVAEQIAEMLRPITDLLFAPAPTRETGRAPADVYDTGELPGPLGRPLPASRTP